MSRLEVCKHKIKHREAEEEEKKEQEEEDDDEEEEDRRQKNRARTERKKVRLGERVSE